MGWRLGVDIGGTTIAVVAATPEGAVVERATVPTNDDGGAGWIERVTSAVTRMVDGMASFPDTAGLCAPGIAAPDGTAIAWMPGRLSGLEGRDWTEALRLGVDVRVLNDAQAALLAEVWLGAARNIANAAMLTLGTGVGGALLCDGRLLRGRMGRAGHLGHISLDPSGPLDIVNTPGSLESAIGTCTLKERSGGRFDSTLALIDAADAGDDEARRIWLHSLDALAAGVVSIVNAVDPEIVILGGGVAKAGDALLHPLAERLDTIEWRPGGQRVRLALAECDEWAGALGAARYGMKYKELTA